MTFPTQAPVTQAMMKRAVDLAERFYLADFGGTDVLALRNGVCVDSAIEDFVLEVERIRTAAEAASAATVAELVEALKTSPIIGRSEDPDSFCERQNDWIRDVYGPALARANTSEGKGA